MVITIAITTLIIVIFGEIIPKILALRLSTNISIIYAPLLFIIHSIVFPIRIVLNLITETINKISSKKKSKYNTMYEEELKTVVNVALEDDIIGREEHYLISNIIEFADLEVRHIMTPHTKIFSLDINTSFSKAIYEVKKSSYKHIPVYEGDIDNIVGMIKLKSLLSLYIENKDYECDNLKEFIDDAYIIPEKKPLRNLLNEFLSQKKKFAILKDEYARTVGIVSLNDILDKILGKLPQENEDFRSIQKLKTGKWFVKGDTKIELFNRIVKSDFISEVAETIGGYVIDKLDKIPNEDDIYEEDGFVFVIKDVSENRINDLIVSKAKKKHINKKFIKKLKKDKKKKDKK